MCQRLVGRWARKPVNHTSWVALVTPTDRPKSVRNRCLIELFYGVVCVVTCPFDIYVGVGAFVIGLDLLLFVKDILSDIKCTQKVAGRLTFDLLTKISTCSSLFSSTVGI